MPYLFDGQNLFKMTRLVLLIAIFLVASCNNKKKEESAEKTLAVWTEFSSKDSIPKAFLVKLNTTFHHDFKIANPDERYNATDLINDSLPQTQLQYLAKNGEYWRLSYVQGGFAKYYVYAEGTMSGDTIVDFRIAKSLRPLNNYDTINKLLIEGLVKFE